MQCIVRIMDTVGQFLSEAAACYGMYSRQPVGEQVMSMRPEPIRRALEQTA